MTTCEDCGLRIQDQESKDGQSICNPCRELVQGEPQIHVSPISRRDLELILAWRSHPEIYRHFRNQNEPLTWSDHLSWFESRTSNQRDFLIYHGGRRVGLAGLNANDEITIYIGDFSAQGEGVATAMIDWLKDRFKTRTPLVAEVSEENEPSKHLFRSCGFRVATRTDGWITFEYNS